MRLAIVCLSVLLVLPSLALEESHTLLRFYIESEEDMNYILINPDELDITESGRAWDYYDIVVQREDYMKLTLRGSRIEVLQDDLENFYASRLDSRTNFGIYHTYSEAIAWMDSLHMLYPEVVSEKWSIGQSHQGNDLWCFRVSDNPEQDEVEPELLFDGLHHAREIMASEMPLMLAEYLAENYGVDPEITYLLDNREVYFVPIVNPDGFLYNESTNPNGGGMWRKNRRNNGGSYGVDPNRNYPYEWGLDSGSSGSPSSETYRGPYAASEPEVQAMIALINDHQFDLRQSWHSYSELTLYPWGYTTADTPDEELFRDIAAEMVKYNGYAPGQPGDVLYIVSGGTFDWDYGAQGEHEKIFGFTNEIGHSGDGFWPPESRRQQLFEDNLWPSLYMIQISGSLRAVQFSHSPAPFTPDFYSPVEVQTIPTGYEGTAIDPASVTLHYRLNGGEFVDQPMTATGVPGEYGSSIPAQAVGSVVEYFLTANDVGGHTGSSPFGAPLNLHYYEIGESFEHTMEAERGWTVGASDDDATTGVWVRVDPVPTGCQPGDDHSADGTLCWITGQHPGGSDGANDVDSGKTTLFSPSYDFSGATSAVFSYWKWYSNDQGADPNNDWWDVDLSNDGGNSWISLEHTTTSSNAWVQESFDLFDHVGEAGVLQLRFIASDEGSGSLVEGGVDDFLLAGIFDTTGDDGLSVSFVDRLHQNNPNPFNPKTEIRFNLAEEGPALLRVFDSRGRVIRVLAEGEHAAGEHLLSWDGRDVTGHPLPSGVYFYRLETRDRVASKKMVLIK